MKLSRLNNKKPTSLHSIDFKVNIHYTLGDLLSEESLYLNCFSAYHPYVQNYLFNKYYDCQKRFSNYKRRTIGIGRPRKMSRYKERYSLNHVDSHEKLSKFKQ